MKNNYIKVFGQATLQVDGACLKNLTQNHKGSMNIVELGTFYGRHAILWNEILEQDSFKYNYITIDEEEYIGSQIARMQAKENLAIYAPSVKKVVAKTYVAAASDFDDANIDILHIDNVREVQKLCDILIAWCEKVSIGGSISYTLPNKAGQELYCYQHALANLQKKGFEIGQYEHFGLLKKVKPELVEKVQNKNKINDKSHNDLIDKSKKQEIV